MKKNKKDYNLTVDFTVTQTAAAPIAPITMSEWDTVDLLFTLSISGAVLSVLKDDPDFRSRIKARANDRLDELIDSVTVNSVSSDIEWVK